MKRQSISRIEAALEQRQANDRLRRLTVESFAIDFSSNDYLGLSKSAWMKQRIDRLSVDLALGSTGSRLLSGNHLLTESTEERLAQFFQSEAALIFNSGYDANTGLLSTVIRPNDIVFYDEAIHASMHQGLKLSGATCFPFKHNDIIHLEHIVKLHANTTEVQWLLCESYYSMDGDAAPISQLLHVAEQFHLNVIVDEAHALGCFGDKGRGLCYTFAHHPALFARVITFGKGWGTHGAAILINQTVKQYLINFCKAFIYTTALPPYSIISIQIALEYFSRFSRAQQLLMERISYFGTLTASQPNIIGEGPVFACLIPGERAVKQKAESLQKMGLDIRPIVAPTVEKGKERLRISIHSFNTKAQILLLTNALKT